MFDFVRLLIRLSKRVDTTSDWSDRLASRTTITLQRRRYYNQLAGHIDVIDIMWAVRLQSVQPVCPTGLTDSRT